MTRRLLLVLLATSAAFLSGCSSMKKSPDKPKLGLAGSTEDEFKTRWVDKRAAELVAQGQAADAARTQALAEFKERYGYTGAAGK